MVSEKRHIQHNMECLKLRTVQPLMEVPVTVERLMVEHPMVQQVTLPKRIVQVAQTMVRQRTTMHKEEPTMVALTMTEPRTTVMTKTLTRVAQAHNMELILAMAAPTMIIQLIMVMKSFPMMRVKKKLSNILTLFQHNIFIKEQKNY